jgi:uncharacterized integral membrane protein
MVRFLKLLVLVPLVVIALAFAIANRAMTIVSFDPFSSAETASPTLAAPLFIVLLLTLMLGVVIGSAATWLAQSRHRHQARRARAESERLRTEAERLRAQAAARAPETRAALPAI